MKGYTVWDLKQYISYGWDQNVDQFIPYCMNPLQSLLTSWAFPGKLTPVDNQISIYLKWNTLLAQLFFFIKETHAFK